jgi:hypothetical protein
VKARYIIADTSSVRRSAGSVLGSSLFNIYTSPIPAIAAVHEVRLKQFSNDTQGYVHFHLDSHHQAMAL